jgi:hypothetical protein
MAVQRRCNLTILPNTRGHHAKGKHASYTSINTAISAFPRVSVAGADSVYHPSKATTLSSHLPEPF